MSNASASASDICTSSRFSELTATCKQVRAASYQRAHLYDEVFASGSHVSPPFSSLLTTIRLFYLYMLVASSKTFDVYCVIAFARLTCV